MRQLSDRPDDPAQDEPPPELRRMNRAPLHRECMVKVGSHNWHMARLRDLTPAGFRVSVLDMPAVGTELKIRIPGLTILRAQVCWARDFEVGCKFDSPLSPYVFEHLLRQ